MGNCQAAEAATVVIQHPGAKGKVERIYKSTSAKEVMSSNPGHYVALIFESRATTNGRNAPVKQLKLLRPDDTLHIGNVYRLVTFEDVIDKFATKKSVRLGKLLKESGALEVDKKRKSVENSKIRRKTSNIVCNEAEQEEHLQESGNNSGSGFSRGVRRIHAVQWKPALQSIAEF